MSLSYMIYYMSGFVMHTIFGYPGRKIEIRPSYCIWGKENIKTTLMPIIIKDFDMSLLIDKDGTVN